MLLSLLLLNPVTMIVEAPMRPDCSAPMSCRHVYEFPLKLGDQRWVPLRVNGGPQQPWIREGALQIYVGESVILRLSDPSRSPGVVVVEGNRAGMKQRPLDDGEVRAVFTQRMNGDYIVRVQNGANVPVSYSAQLYGLQHLNKFSGCGVPPRHDDVKTIKPETPWFYARIEFGACGG